MEQPTKNLFCFLSTLRVSDQYQDRHTYHYYLASAHGSSGAVVSSALDTATSMVLAGVVNHDQYHNILISGDRATFIDFGSATFLNEAKTPEEARDGVKRFFFMLLIMVPRNLVSRVRCVFHPKRLVLCRTFQTG